MQNRNGLIYRLYGTNNFLEGRDRSEAIALLDEMFRSGTVPDPKPNGRYAGKVLLLDIAPGVTQLLGALTHSWMPWKGKRFDSTGAIGDNVLSRDSRTLVHVLWPSYKGCKPDRADTYSAFAFRTYVAPGKADPDRDVLKIDYDINGNPPLVRRVLDEIVQINGNRYLGKAHLKLRDGKWKTAAYFTLEDRV